MGSELSAAQTSELDLSIVVVSWNTCRLLDECLASVVEEVAYQANRMVLRTEVFVVDNGSTDGSVEMVRARYPQVHLIANTHNPGFAGANNQALALARGRYSLLLNPDTVVLEDGLGALVRFMDAHPRAGAAGARLLNADRTLQPSCSPEPTLGRELWRMFHLDRIVPYGVYDMYSWPVTEPRPVHTVQGAAMLVRREALEQVGVLDASYFMYSEEVDWCTRIKRGGWEIYWVPAAQIVHYGGQSSKQVADAMFLQLYRGKIQYFHKHWGRFSTFLYKLILGLATLGRLAVSPLALLESPDRRQRHLRLARQYSLLLRALPAL
jgi:GT2 family glycosyltransferase